MINEITPGLFHLQVPYPDSPLRNINVYVIKGERNLIVDTGVNLEGCKKELVTGLKEIGVNPKDTDFFITHGHPDHYGLLGTISQDTSTVYFTRIDAALMMDGIQASFRRVDNASQNGFSDAEVEFVRKNSRYISSGRDRYNFHFVKEGDILTYGDFKFTGIETPGHSRGHMCLYDAGKKALLSGDHILIDISPNVSCWSGGENPLADYLVSLDKLYNFEVSIVLPGHRRTFTDLKGRIVELKQHHEKRAAETLTVLGRYGAQNAYQVASHLTWRVNYGSWEAFPIWQKFSAVGETLAHLNYLESEGKVNRENGGVKLIFSLK